RASDLGRSACRGCRHRNRRRRRSDLARWRFEARAAGVPSARGLAAIRRRRRPDAQARAQEARQAMTLTRRELLKRGAVALAAGNVYSLLDGLAAAPARAAVTAAARSKEQYLLAGQQVVLELGIEVIVPPLHHRIVTARVRKSGKAAQTRLEHALAGVEARYPATAAGGGVTVGWGLPYV